MIVIVYKIKVIQKTKLEMHQSALSINLQL